MGRWDCARSISEAREFDEGPRLDFSSDLSCRRDYEAVEGAVLWMLGLQKDLGTSKSKGAVLAMGEAETVAQALRQHVLAPEEDIRACAEALAKHADDPSEGPQCARKLLRALTPEIDLVAHALATHLAEFIQEEKQMELVATALAQHMEEQKIGCDPAQVIAKALLTHAALTFSGEQELLKGYSMEGEATPFRVAKSPAQLLKMHAALRKELLEGIQRQNRVQMRSALNRGASVRAHYYSSRVPARLGMPELGGTAKGPRSSLVNPVDWAVLEGFYQEAIFLLDLTEGHVSFNRDEERSSLQVVQMAKECRQAVVVACQKGQELLLRALLAKGASCLQQDAFERSALHVAALVGDEVAVKLLLERGAWAPEDRKPEVLRLAEAHRMHCIIEAAGVAAGPTINLLNPERPAFQEVIQVLEDTREAARALQARRQAQDKCGLQPMRVAKGPVHTPAEPFGPFGVQESAGRFRSCNRRSILPPKQETPVPCTPLSTSAPMTPPPIGIARFLCEEDEDLPLLSDEELHPRAHRFCLREEHMWFPGLKRSFDEAFDD
ncbi:unnamed protein product [Effrenium voratum]|nr:unnamed protein product [Effrenium voratum]